MIWFTNNSIENDTLFTYYGSGSECDLGNHDGGGWGDGLLDYIRGGSGSRMNYREDSPLIYYFEI